MTSTKWHSQHFSFSNSSFHQYGQNQWFVPSPPSKMVYLFSKAAGPLLAFLKGFTRTCGNLSLGVGAVTLQWRRLLGGVGFHLRNFWYLETPSWEWSHFPSQKGTSMIFRWFSNFFKGGMTCDRSLEGVHGNVMKWSPAYHCHGPVMLQRVTHVHMMNNFWSVGTRELAEPPHETPKPWWNGSVSCPRWWVARFSTQLHVFRLFRCAI